MDEAPLSYWVRVRTSEPATIRDPEQYEGSDSISVACTQTNLSAAAQSKLVQRWCDLLPTLTHVKRVWFRSQVPQGLFDAASSMPGLTDLWVKWSSVKDLASLSRAHALIRLHLGGSAQVQSLSPLSSLTQLKWLTLENIKRVQSISFVCELKNLDGFGFSGGIWGRPELNTLAPLADQTGLVWLDLSGTKVRDGSLRPLSTLRALKELDLPNYYSLEEYAFLRAHLPQLDQDLRPYYSLSGLGLRCKKCAIQYLVLLRGRGTKKLCPDCDAAALSKHCQAFEDLVLLHARERAA